MIFHTYAIGDKNNQSKFNGPPSPSKILRQYDKPKRCPKCGSPLYWRPKGVVFMSKKRFDEEFMIVNDMYIVPRKGLVDEHMERLTSVEGDITGTHDMLNDGAPDNVSDDEASIHGS